MIFPPKDNQRELKEYGIDTRTLKKTFESNLSEKISENFEIFLENIKPFLKITWDTQTALRKNLELIFWEEYINNNYKKFFEIVNSKNISKEIESLNNFYDNLNEKSSEEEKNKLLKEFINKMEKTPEFNKFLLEYFENNEDVIKKFNEAKKISDDILNNQEIKIDLLKWIRKYEFTFISLILITTGVSDIDAIIRFIAPQVDIASSWIWKLTAIWDALEKWYISHLVPVLWATPWLIDSSSKVLFIWLFVWLLSTLKWNKINKTLPLVWVWWLMTSAIFVAAFLQAISWSMSSMADKEKFDYLNKWVWELTEKNIRLENNFNNWEKIDKNWKFKNNWQVVEIINSRKTKIDDVVSWDIEKSWFEIWKEFIGVFYEWLKISHSWWEIVENFNKEKDVKEFIKKLEYWSFDDKWWFNVMDSYIDQIDEIWNSKMIYKKMFNEIIKDIEWKASNWTPLFWPSSFEKMSIILKVSWFDNNWKTFEDKIYNFLNYIYEDNLIKSSDYFNLIKEKIKNNNSITFKMWDVSWNWFSLEDISKEFKIKNDRKIKEFKDKIKKLILSIKNDWLTEFKISDFNQIIKDFNKYIKEDLSFKINEFTEWRKAIVLSIESKFKKIDEKYENKWIKYEVANLSYDEFDSTNQLDEIPERFITANDVLNELISAINYYKKTWEIKDVIIQANSKLEISLWMNFADINLILFLIWLWIYKRERIIWWVKMKFKEFQKFRKKELEKATDDIKWVFEEIKNICDEEVGNIKEKVVFEDRITELQSFINDFKILENWKWEKLLYQKDTMDILLKEYNFNRWKITQIKTPDYIPFIEDLTIWENDSVFINSIISSSNWDINIWWISLIDNNWNFSIKKSLDNDKNKISLDTEEFKEILADSIYKKLWIEDMNQIKFNVWILISKKWFYIVPYDDKWNMTILEKTDLYKYIK